jgi:hypothetical protein
MLELQVPNEVYETLQLDSNECRKVYGLIHMGGDRFRASPSGWARTADDFEHLGWELPQEVIQSWIDTVYGEGRHPSQATY